MSIADLWFDIELADADPIVAANAFWDCFCTNMIVPRCIRFTTHVVIADDLPEYAVPGSLEFDPFNPPLFEGERLLPGQNVTTLDSPIASMPKGKEEIIEGWSRWVSEWKERGTVHLQCWGCTRLMYGHDGTAKDGWFLMEKLPFESSAVRVPILTTELRFDLSDAHRVTLSLTSWARVWGEWTIAQDEGPEFWVKKQGLELEVAERNALMLADTAKRFASRIDASQTSWCDEGNRREPDIGSLVRSELTREFGAPRH